MNINAIATGVISGLITWAILEYGKTKRRKYKKRKIEDLEYEKDIIESISKKPTELYRNSFTNLFYLIFLIAFANIMRLFHGVLYDAGVVWQQWLTEGCLWLVVAILSLRYKRLIDSTYNKKESISKINQKIERIKAKS